MKKGLSMKYLSRLLVVLSMLLPVAVWSQGLEFHIIEYVNLYYNATSKTLYLAQTTEWCTKNTLAFIPNTLESGTCVASEEIDNSSSTGTVSFLIQDLLRVYWKHDNADASKYQSTTVKLASDIDFDGRLILDTDANEYKCSSNYFGTDFFGKVFDGSGKQISHICGVSNAGEWTSPMGLFNSISDGVVKNIKLDSVDFIILRKTSGGTSVSADEKDYHPVGGLAGYIENSQVENISLGYVNVSAPLAGGLAGYVEKSTFKDIKTTTDGAIIVTNDIVLTKNNDNSKMGTYKTVLGGLAGSSKFSTFENIALNLYLENSAMVDSSAIGGVAGLYVYADEYESKPYLNQNIKITVPTTVKGPTGDVSGVFTGATSLGGVFGETKRVAGNSNGNTRLYIDDVQVTNMKASATKVAGSKPIGVYWGGVVGKSDLCLGGSLKISHSKANVKFDIMQSVNGTYKNYWGGIVGFVGCSSTNNFGSHDDLGFSLKYSKATGYMRLGGGTSNSKIYASSTLGGLVGEALLAVENDAVMLDTAEINIVYTAKNTIDKSMTTAKQSIHVGGIIGAANIFKTSGVISNWKGLIFKGYFDITDDGFNSYVGGIVGRFPLDGSDNSRISFNDILVQTNAPSGNKLITYATSGTTSYASDAYLGGVCGNCNSISKMEKTAIVGNVSKTAGTSAKADLRKSYYVGGLVGRAKISSYPIFVRDTYSKGNITSGFPSGLTTEPKTYTYIGYLFGTLSGNKGKSSEFLSNYHYSEDLEDVAAIADGDGKEYSTFDPVYSNSTAEVNVRNCTAKNLTAADNGCDLSTNMASSAFNDKLNKRWTNPEDYVWEQTNADALPTLRKSSYGKPETFAVTFKNGSEVVQEYTVEKGWPSPVPDVPAVDSKGCTFKEWQSDDDYSFVTKAITVNAVYGDCPVYTVTFKGLDGKTLKTVPNVTAGESVTAPAADEVPEYNGMCFTKWKNKYDLSYVTGDWTIEPESKTCVYEVTFFYTNANGKRISQTQNVEYDKDAIPPSKSELLLESDDGVCFDGWDKEYTHVKGNLEVTEQFVICTYPVVFNDLNGKPIENPVTENGTLLPYPQIVEYGKSAVAPKDPEPVFNSMGNGRCFDGWSKNTDDYTKVTRNMNVSANSKDCYQVFFYGLDGQLIVGATTADGKSLDNPQIVDKGKAAIAPKDPEPTADGKCFSHWDEDLSSVTKGLKVKAKSKPCEYTVKFYDLRGFVIDGSEQVVLYGEAAVAPTDPSPKDDLCFIGWDTDFSAVKGNLEVKPNTKKCVFTVNFYGLDGTTVIKTQNVQEGLSARAPATPEPLGDLCFNGWDTDFSEVKGDLEVHALSKDCPASSSSAASSSSVVQSSAASSSSTPIENPSSSSMDPISSSSFQDDNSSSSYDTASSSSVILSSSEESSSSFVESSSSISTPDYSSSSTPIENLSSSSFMDPISSSSFQDDNSSSSFEESIASSSSWYDVFGSSDSFAPQSSSGNTYVRDLVGPVVTQEGNALRMTFTNNQTDSPIDVNYHIVVTSDAGIYLDTVVRGRDVESVKNGTWRLDPAPVGEYSVTFTLTDGYDSASYVQPFVAEKEMHVDVDSSFWQTYSLYAFCHQKGDKCVNDIETLLYSGHDNWAVKQCEQMKDEYRESGAEDEYLREQMEQACRIASQEQSGAVTSVFWWDETNPVGDYWQYRRFKVTQNFDSTRGYWYGFANKQTLSLDLQTPNMNDEIVWTLNNNFSGWNLVANPFGWYIKLPQENDVEFRKWDPKAGECVPVDTLGPYEAIWVHVDESKELRIPLKAAIILEGEREVLSKSADSEDWNLRVVLEDDNGKRDSWNELVVGKTAKSFSEPPAGMGDRVNLSIVENGKRLEKSVKEISDDIEWKLEASATSSRKGHLSFVGLESVWAKGMRVYATMNDETVEVVNDRPLDVQLSLKAKNVSVRVTKNTVPVSIAKNLLKNFHVNQMQNVLNVGFDAAANLAGSNVKVSIVGIDGRVFATGKSIANEGSNVVSMKKPKCGVYFVRMQVGSQSASARIMVR